MDNDRVDLILRAMNGDRAAWERIRAGGSDSFVPMKDLDEPTRAKVTEFFATANATGKIDEAIGKIDPQWVKDHTSQMENLRKLVRTFEKREGNHGEGKI